MQRLERGGKEMSSAIVSLDRDKKSVTIEAVDGHGRMLATGRIATDSNGYRLMLTWVGRSRRASRESRRERMANPRVSRRGGPRPC